MDKPKPKTKAKRKKIAIRQTVNGNEVVAEIYKASDGVVSKGGSVTVRNPHGYEPKAI